MATDSLGNNASRCLFCSQFVDCNEDVVKQLTKPQITEMLQKAYSPYSKAVSLIMSSGHPDAEEVIKDFHDRSYNSTGKYLKPVKLPICNTCRADKKLSQTQIKLRDQYLRLLEKLDIISGVETFLLLNGAGIKPLILMPECYIHAAVRAAAEVLFSNSHYNHFSEVFAHDGDNYKYQSNEASRKREHWLFLYLKSAAQQIKAGKYNNDTYTVPAEVAQGIREIKDRFNQPLHLN